MSKLQSFSTLQAKNPARLVDGETEDPLLRFAEPISGSHALVIAPNGLNLLCSLLRQGCSAATTLRLTERPDAKAYDLVLAPCVSDAVQIGRLVVQAKRALVATGRFLAYVPHSAGDADDVDGTMIRALRLAGFASVRSRSTPNGLLIRADLVTLGWSTATNFWGRV